MSLDLDSWITTDPRDAEDYYAEKHAPKCDACGEPMLEDVYEAFGNNYCRECAKQVVRENMRMDLIKDYLFDRKVDAKGQVCSGCEEPIAGDAYELDGEVMCEECAIIDVDDNTLDDLIDEELRDRRTDAWNVAA